MGVDLKAIRERAEKATPGPWRAVPTGADDDTTGAAWVGQDGAGSFLMQGYDGEFLNRLDADFIAHAREDIPALLERVRVLEEALRGIAKLAEDRERKPTSRLLGIRLRAEDALRALSTERMPSDG